MKKTAIILTLLFIGLYMFLSCIAFEEADTTAIIFYFVTPLVLPLSISIVVYSCLMKRSRKPIIDYLKAFLFSIVASVVCLYGAICVLTFVYSYLENKYAGTDMYYQYFERPLGWDEDTLRALPISLSMSVGAMAGGVILWCFVSALRLITKSVKKKIRK